MRVRPSEAGMWAGVRPVSMEGQAARGRDPRAAVGPSRSSGTLLWEHVALGSDVPGRDPGQRPQAETPGRVAFSCFPILMQACGGGDSRGPSASHTSWAKEMLNWSMGLHHVREKG